MSTALFLRAGAALLAAALYLTTGRAAGKRGRPRALSGAIK